MNFTPPHIINNVKLTECDRIIESGILPKSFLEGEVRLGFEVTPYLKKIWAIAIDTLLEFNRVCQKYNLRYFLAYGSLLGAVRHNGFIPWDDDMDVFMLRADYNVLLSHPEEFQHPYFLQTPYTDPGYFFSYAKLRNSNTSCITTQFRYQKINWGQNFDIFPLDNFKLEGGEEYFSKLAVLGTDISNYMRSSNPKPSSEEERKRIESYSGRDPMSIYEEIQNMAQQYNGEETGLLAVTSAYLYGFKKGIYHVEDFQEAIPCDFECVKALIPNGFDRILTTVYGDYMQLPPKDKRGLWHSNIIYDPDRSYLEIQNQDGIIY